jgi:hypothetical protein
MLGELIIEEQGKITAQKVLDDAGPKMEASFQTSGTVLGVEETNLGTFSSVLTPGSRHDQGRRNGHLERGWRGQVYRTGHGG